MVGKLTVSECLSEFCWRRCNCDSGEVIRRKCRKQLMECSSIKVKDLQWLIRFVMKKEW